MASSFSSSVITCINSVLDVVGFLPPPYYYIFEKQRRNLKIFVLLAGQFGTDVHLGSILITIEDFVTRISPKIHPNSLDLEYSGELRAFQNRVLEVAYRVKFLIDHLIVGDISDSFSMQFDSVMEEIQNIKTDTWTSSYGKRLIVKEVSSTSSRAQPSQKMASITTEIVGFHDEARSIMDRLQRGSKKLRVIAIVGMGGLGKTTLAAKVYDDPGLMYYFYVRARCTVYLTFDKRKLLLELLDQMHAENYSEMTQDDLAEKLRKHLKGKRYLIFLDDEWTIEAWNRLRASFPDDSFGSRIILTCRNYDAVPVAMLDEEPLYLRELNKKECLELLQRKLFPGKDWPLELDDLGMQIAEKCKGLPLTIVIVAGLLRTREQEGWKELVDGLSSGVVSSTEQCIKMASSSSSSVITCINYALDVVGFLLSPHLPRFGSYSMFEKQRHRLRNLKIFVLLAGKFGTDVHLGSLLITIEDFVTRISPKILPNSLDLEDFGARDELFDLVERFASDFQSDFESLKEGVDEWYIATSNNTGKSNSLTADEVGQISESIWENLVDLPRFSLVLAEVMEPLLEHMNFLKNFCSFTTWSGVDHGQMKDFLTHTEAVAISAAHLCYLCGDNIEDEEWLKGMQSKISMLVQKIKPIDPQVCEAYTQVISCSKLTTRIDAPTRDMDEDSTIVMKNFIDFLIPILWDMLRLDTCHVVCLKDNRQLLYERLRSLRTILKKMEPKDIDEKTRDDIGDMVCDAGVLVCSFYHKNVEIEDLCERIKVFLAEAREEVPQKLTFNPSSIDIRQYVEFLVENLMELTGRVEPIVQSRVQSIQEVLLYFKSFLEEIVELRCEQAELRAFQNRVLEVADRVKFLIDHLIVGDISDSFSMQFDSVMEDIQNMKTDAWTSSFGKRRDTTVKEVSRTSSHVLPSQKMASLKTEIVGFHDEASSIKDRLQSGLRGSKQRQVIAIVGMGGLGKTTLAAKVYDDPTIMLYFSAARARCTVSQTLDRKKLLLELLDQIHAEKCYEMTEHELADKLRKKLSGKRYLIFLDDVWTIEAWNSLSPSFPNDSSGSRIILTSRNHDVAMLDQEPHCLQELNKEESLELLRRQLFPREGEVWPPALYDLGMQIAEKCKGLPLTIVLVAGLLKTTDQEGWKEIVDGLSSGAVSITDQCMSSMELSYQHLPDYLKPCFLYFGAFPEGQEVSVRRLIPLWIAEEFIRKYELKSVEDAAEDYLKDLIGRSLIMVAKRGSMGDVQTCRIHDLLRDFCLRKSKVEHFLHLVKGYDELLAFNEPCNLRRLCIQSEPDHLKESKLFCPRARSLLFFSRYRGWHKQEALINIFLVHIFKFVEVLDLEEISLGYGFPVEIELLVQLRYLAIRGDIRVIPSWVGNLSMLETFIVNPCGGDVSFPDTIWNLQNLKYLYLRSGEGELPSGNLDNNSVLNELDALCSVVFYCGPRMEKQMSKFPNIRKLKCYLCCPSDDTEAFYNIGVADFLIRLESLHLRGRYRFPYKIQFELSFPANLKKLTLGGCYFPWSKISSIGLLPNLEVLKLLDDSFIEETWEMEEGKLFPKLKYLKLHGLRLARWTASDDSDDQFPCLEKLVLAGVNLEKMPSCLESIQTLEMIEVREYCSEATISLVKRIEEQQVSLGNTALKVNYVSVGRWW